MNEKDIMIGDWMLLNLYPFVCTPTPHKVHPTVLYRATTGTCVKLEPIPLTEEILKANGWINRVDGKFGSGGNVVRGAFVGVNRWHPKRMQERMCLVSFSSKKFGLLVTGRFHYINYVHELQHALRLCGLNNLADNFKIE